MNMDDEIQWGESLQPFNDANKRQALDELLASPVLDDVEDGR